MNYPTLSFCSTDNVLQCNFCLIKNIYAMSTFLFTSLEEFIFVIFSEKNYAQAKYHFLHSKDGFNCASMLIEYQTNNGYTSEVDLFVAQTVLE